MNTRTSAQARYGLTTTGRSSPEGPSRHASESDSSLGASPRSDAPARLPASCATPPASGVSSDARLREAAARPLFAGSSRPETKRSGALAAGCREGLCSRSELEAELIGGLLAEHSDFSDYGKGCPPPRYLSGPIRTRLPAGLSEAELFFGYGSQVVLGALTACGIAASWGVLEWVIA